MTDLLKKIEDHKEAILLGEIGALFHMIGKASAEFLQAHSKEGGARDTHQNLKHIPQLEQYLRRPELKESFSINVKRKRETLSGDFTDFITKYKRDRDKDGGPDCNLLWFFNTCHRMTSADEKGVVRRLQSIHDMWITTPFGHRVHKIDPECVEKKRAEMDEGLARVFERYINSQISIECLREEVGKILKPGFDYALGETRVPANDVTLWAQSYGVAALYKPALATLAIEEDPCQNKNENYDFKQVKWRLLGVGWNGLGFLQKGLKPADILARQKILRDVIDEIQRQLEVHYPTGNLFYQDINGVFFTFPGIDNDKALDLVRELSSHVIPLIRKKSDNELWPFITLSKPSRTLTGITGEIQIRDKFAALPRVAVIFSLEKDDSTREDTLLMPGPTMIAPAGGQDICPVCSFRSKPLTKMSCKTCEKRRYGRQEKWWNNRDGQTIWVDEVADADNRVALLTLHFDLSKWLSGDWFSTIFSQSIIDWRNSNEYMKAVKKRKQIESYGKRNSISNIEFENPTLETAIIFSKLILNRSNPNVRAELLQTFFDKSAIEVTQNPNDDNFVDNHLKRLAERLNLVKLTPEDLITSLFTQNPSPGRLMRIWEETGEFFEAWQSIIENEVFTEIERPKRLFFTTESPVKDVHKNGTYRITIPGLAPGPVAVLCLSEDRKEFLTIDSLEKFNFRKDSERWQGFEAVQRALKENVIFTWRDDETGDVVPQPSNHTRIQNTEIDTEYLPLILFAKSPIFLQLLLPASCIPNALRKLLCFFNQRFALVQGKLPLRVSLLVAKRKFPLYVLLEAGQMMLDPHLLDLLGAVEGREIHPWWKTTSEREYPFYEDFYGYYPKKRLNVEGKFNLEDLAPINKEEKFLLTPGYFDFDFLGSTADRHRISYKKINDELRRRSICYGPIRPRPIPFHRLKDFFDMWEIISHKMTRTQRHALEEALITKLEEWKTVKEDHMPVFTTFAKAALRRSFEGSWQKIQPDDRHKLEDSLQNGSLLETLELFSHIIKED